MGLTQNISTLKYENLIGGYNIKTLKNIGASLSLLLATPLLAFAPLASATTNTIHPANMQGWGFAQETATGSGSMVSGPETPPLGTGSANLTVDSTGGVVIAKNGYKGLAFSDLDILKYSTYRTTGSSALAIALQFDFDTDVTDTDNSFMGRVTYEPYHTQVVETGEWQEWDTLNGAAGAGTGNWWLTRTTISASCTQSNPCTLSELITLFPNSGIRNTANANVWLKAGGGWTGGFNGNVDELTINDDTYNFEPVVTASNKEACKNEGWRTANTPSYKNQGDCVSSFASKNKANGNPVANFFRSLTN